MLRKTSIWCILATLIFIADVGNAEVTVEGTVTTGDGQPVVGLKVRVYRGHKPLATGVTDAKGHYTIKVTEGTPLNRIFYHATGYHAGEVNDLSGNAEQKINKVIHREGDKLTAQDAIRQWMVYEHLYWADKLSESPDPSMLRQQYEKSIRSLPITDLTSEKATQVLKEYNLSD